MQAASWHARPKANTSEEGREVVAVFVCKSVRVGGRDAMYVSYLCIVLDDVKFKDE